jgi:hypothetical protein
MANKHIEDCDRFNPTIILTPIELGKHADIDYLTWAKYTEETFYLTTQAWRIEKLGDALVGMGPNPGEYHVVARIGVDVYEMRGEDASIDKLLRSIGLSPTIP